MWAKEKTKERVVQEHLALSANSFFNVNLMHVKILDWGCDGVTTVLSSVKERIQMLSSKHTRAVYSILAIAKNGHIYSIIRTWTISSSVKFFEANTHHSIETNRIQIGESARMQRISLLDWNRTHDSAAAAFCLFRMCVWVVCSRPRALFIGMRRGDRRRTVGWLLMQLLPPLIRRTAAEGCTTGWRKKWLSLTGS